MKTIHVLEEICAKKSTGNVSKLQSLSMMSVTETTQILQYMLVAEDVQDKGVDLLKINK